MTVSSTTTKVSYNGDNSTTVFAYTFKIFDDDDITVILRTVATGTESVQTKTTDYSVSGVGNTNGGNITFVTAPASGVTVVLLRETAQTQTTDYTPNDPFPASSHEDALDKITLTVQDQQEELNRALKLSRTNTMASTEFTVGATTRANKILAFDSSGELAVTQEIGTFQGNWTASTSYFERDLVRDSTTNNIFIVNSAHTSSGSQPLTTNANSAKYDLILEAELQGNLLGDTTPQLGGNLDLNSNDITGTGNIKITGSVGIGTNSPSALLHLASNAPYINFEDVDNNQDWQLQATAWFALRNQTTNSELLRVTSGGNVGIGTNLPDSGTPLHVEESSASLGANPAASAFLVERAGNVGMTLGTANTGECSIFMGDTDSLTAGRVQYDNSNDSLQFWANSLERMRIDSSGRLLVNRTSAANSGLIELDYAPITAKDKGIVLNNSNGTTGGQACNFLFSGTTVGNISTTASSTSYNTSSDYRLKENVVADWDATTRLKQLNPVRFNFIADADTTVDGFLAHEVQDVVPEAVTGTKDAMQNEEYEVTPAVLDDDGNIVTDAVMGTRSVPEYQGIDQSKLVPLLVKTIQELEARIASLEAN